MGGGAGGAVREAGGSFGKREAAQEEEYFRRLQSAQLKELKDHLQDEVKHHEIAIKEHQREIWRYRERWRYIERYGDIEREMEI
ncbi:hypothetical protein ACJMK2_003008 [Sinanodonta woodiana]|uniref:ATP synthase F1 subunit epsilon n=1 Tax=Sinanodonta woodiana TaxID=1069815 RepID=A0ABD3Y098_SINWO